jgi:hypothetical protein
MHERKKENLPRQGARGLKAHSKSGPALGKSHSQPGCAKEAHRRDACATGFRQVPGKFELVIFFIPFTPRIGGYALLCDCLTSRPELSLWTRLVASIIRAAHIGNAHAS